jgi:hypothetical protein
MNKDVVKTKELLTKVGNYDTSGPFFLNKGAHVVLDFLRKNGASTARNEIMLAARLICSGDISSPLFNSLSLRKRNTFPPSPDWGYLELGGNSVQWPPALDV